MARRLRADVAVQMHPDHGEGPVWDERDGVLVWVDIIGQRVHRFDPETGEDQQVDVGEAVGAAVPREGGGLVLALENEFALLEPTGELRTVAAPLDDVDIRFNDGKCDPAGRFWAGTMAWDASPGAGTLYRLEPHYAVEAALTDLTISNGMAWSADQRTMYFIDSPTQGVDAFDYDAEDGRIRRRGRVVEIPEVQGLPDGMTIDAEDCLWVALFRGGAVHRYTPEGRLDLVVELPVTLVTSCAFGGPDHEHLYITTSPVELNEDERARQMHAGAVFVCEPGVPGRPAYCFAG